MMWRGKGPDGTHHPWCSIMQPRGHLTCSCDTVSEVGHRDHGVQWIHDDDEPDGWYAQVDTFTAIGSDGREHGLTLTGSIQQMNYPAVRAKAVEQRKRVLEARMRGMGVWIE